MSGTGVALAWSKAALQSAPFPNHCLENVMTINRIKLALIALFVLLFVVLVAFRAKPVNATVPSALDDPAATYKAKCAMCHTATAAKFFDAAKTDDQHVETILKGKKGEKPPYMPAFADKGITPEFAQALVAHMRQLKVASD